MIKQRLPKVPKVSNWEQMSNVNNFLYYREKLKTEIDLTKIITYRSKFNELNSSIKTFSDALNS